MRAASAGVEVGRVQEADRVAVAGHTVDRLAQALHLASLERELTGVHDRLVADVEEAHARRLVGREPFLARTHHAEAPPVAVHVVPERVPDVGPLGEGADGVGGDQADATEDGVSHERVAVEEPLLVVTQREVVEGARAVPAHDVPRPELGGPAADGGPAGRQAAVDHRPGQQVERHQDQGDTDGEQGDGGVAVDVLGEARRHCTPTSRSRRAEEHLGPVGQGVVVHVAGDLHADEAAQGRQTPPTARMRNAVTSVAGSVWARKRSRCTISSVSTPAQTRS